MDISLLSRHTPAKHIGDGVLQTFPRGLLRRRDPRSGNPNSGPPTRAAVSALHLHALCLQGTGLPGRIWSREAYRFEQAWQGVEWTMTGKSFSVDFVAKSSASDESKMVRVESGP
jgi:hypothetical protein